MFTHTRIGVVDRQGGSAPACCSGCTRPGREATLATPPAHTHSGLDAVAKGEVGCGRGMGLRRDSVYASECLLEGSVTDASTSRICDCNGDGVAEGGLMLECVRGAQHERHG